MAKVLVIDDDSAMRRMVMRTLTGVGHQAVEAADGVQGIRLFGEDAPDIVLTDIVMPEKEGLQTIGEIRALAPETRIIAMSGAGPDGGELYLTIANHIGADAVLLKPFRPDQLIAAVDKLLTRDGPSA